MAQESKSGLMWMPILEKAWAKLKGSYEMADGGLLENGLRMLTGVPVFYYQTRYLSDTS